MTHSTYLGEDEARIVDTKTIDGDVAFLTYEFVRDA